MRGSYLDTYTKTLGATSGARNHPLVWGLHPYSDVTAFGKAYAAHRPIPAPSQTLVARFARALSTVGYHQNTQIWFNEISACQYYDMQYQPQPTWTPAVQAAAGQYLLAGLPRAADGPAQPKVTGYSIFIPSDVVQHFWQVMQDRGFVTDSVAL